jgi:hypothetical protein
MDENPYRSPETCGTRQVQRLPLHGKELIWFFVGGWLSVLAGMIFSAFAIGTLFEAAQRASGGMVLDRKLIVLIAMALGLGGTLLGGWLAGRLYRIVYSRVTSRRHE